MKRYKLLKDLPTFKAGDMFYMSEYGDLIYDGDNVGIKACTWQILERFPDILTDWFEEIQEPTDSIHWKPKNGDEYFYISDYGDVYSDIWRGNPIDNERLALGIIYRTEEEIEKAKERELAEARLRRTSNFKPDFKNGNGGWVVMYDHFERVLAIECYSFCDSGEPVRYETEEEALKSIRENEQDWLTYFNVEDC